MEKEEILSHVKKEIDAIKKYASKKQIDRLDFDTFSPYSFGGCIYGQMTGHCESLAAAKLIQKCDTVFCYLSSKNLMYISHPNPVTNLNRDHTILEWFISHHTDNNKNIIAYLKGEISNLELIMKK